MVKSWAVLRPRRWKNIRFACAAMKSSSPSASEGVKKDVSLGMVGRASWTGVDPQVCRAQDRARALRNGLVLLWRHYALPFCGASLHRNPASALLPAEPGGSLRERAIHCHARAFRMAGTLHP